MSEYEVKKDCFGYDKQKNSCRVLNQLWCRCENCKFYKTKKQFEADQKKYK